MRKNCNALEKTYFSWKKRIAKSCKELQRVATLRHEKELQRFFKDLLFLGAISDRKSGGREGGREGGRRGGREGRVRRGARARPQRLQGTREGAGGRA